jgi:nicotinic acid mononucleotide adenylyltransferase
MPCAVRVLMLGIFTAHRDWVPAVSRPPGHLQAVQEALAIIVDAMQAYFTPVRFYSRWYPYFGYRTAMVHIALERTRQMRRISSSMEQLEAATLALHDTSVPPQLLAQLHDRILQLQLAIQRMSNIKEYRTPQVGAGIWVRVSMGVAAPLAGQHQGVPHAAGVGTVGPDI